MALTLSDKTKELVQILFPEDDRKLVENILYTEAADNIPFYEESTPREMERIRFSILKLSKGKLDLLDEALTLAKIDWRDLFTAAKFGQPRDHIKWYDDIVENT